MTDNPRDNVVQLTAQAHNEINEAEMKERRAFNALSSDYLGVCAKLARQGLTDKECDALCGEFDNLVWAIIRTPAPLDYHLNFKFDVMREVMDRKFVEWPASRAA